MTINMEVKKDGLHQLQSGSWKLTLTVNAEDMSMEIIQAAMGSPYGLAMVPIQYDDTPPNLDHFTPVSANNAPTEKSEGERLKQRACILCGEKKFQQYCIELGYYYTTRDTGDVLFGKESTAIRCIYAECGIESRKQLVTDKGAQERFIELDYGYKEWLKPSIDETYKENLEQF